METAAGSGAAGQAPRTDADGAAAVTAAKRGLDNSAASQQPRKKKPRKQPRNRRREARELWEVGLVLEDIVRDMEAAERINRCGYISVSLWALRDKQVIQHRSPVLPWLRLARAAALALGGVHTAPHLMRSLPCRPGTCRCYCCTPGALEYEAAGVGVPRNALRCWGEGPRSCCRYARGAGPRSDAGAADYAELASEWHERQYRGAEREAARAAREELRLRPALLAWERARLRLGASWVSGEPVVEKRPAERAGEPAFARLARAFDLWCAFSADDDAPPRECDSQPPPGTSYCRPCRMPEDAGGAAAGCCGAAAGHGYDGCSCESSRAPRGYRGDDQQLMMPDDG